MIVIDIDTSAILSIFLREDDAAEFAVAIEADDDPMISAATLLETSIVLGAKELVARADADTWLDGFIEKAGISVEAMTIDQIRIARDAYAVCGRGSGHGAQWKFGDCSSYALSRRRGVALLFKGGDFALTDVECARGSAQGASN